MENEEVPTGRNRAGKKRANSYGERKKEEGDLSSLISRICKIVLN